LKGVASREFVRNGIDVFCCDGRRGLLALAGLARLHDGEEGAVLGLAVLLLLAGVALVDGLLQSVDVPSVEEITVPRVASGVTSSIDERPSVGLLPAASKVVDVPGDLVEELHHGDWVGRGANAIVQPRQVCDVGSVVSAVQVDTVPACRHVNAGIKTIRAVHGGEALHVLDFTGAEASPLDGTLAELSLAPFILRVLPGAGLGVATDHAESFGEGFEPLSAISGVTVSTVLIVDKEASVWNRLKLSFGLIMEVELGEPVLRKILFHEA